VVVYGQGVNFAVGEKLRHNFAPASVICSKPGKAGVEVGSAEIAGRSMTVTMRKSPSEHWDEANFRAVFLQHYARIVGMLVRLVGDRAHAEEVANNAFWRLYRQPALQIDGNVGGWLYRTATNLGIDALRASTRRRQYEDAAARNTEKRALEGAATEGPLDYILREEKARRVREALALIKPGQAQLLVLRASGLSYKELAEALEVKMSGIGTMLNRAEEEFRNRYLALHPNEENL
jgi:RNA polymerase sigma factor (sigma-70 family)